MIIEFAGGNSLQGSGCTSRSSESYKLKADTGIGGRELNSRANTGQHIVTSLCRVGTKLINILAHPPSPIRFSSPIPLNFLFHFPRRNHLAAARGRLKPRPHIFNRKATFFYTLTAADGMTIRLRLYLTAHGSRKHCQELYNYMKSILKSMMVRLNTLTNCVQFDRTVIIETFPSRYNEVTKSMGIQPSDISFEG